MFQLRFRTRRTYRHHRTRSPFRLTTEGYLISEYTPPNNQNSQPDNSSDQVPDADLVQQFGEYATPLPALNSKAIHLALNRLYPLNFIRRVQETHPRRQARPVFQDEDTNTEKSDTDTVDTSSFSCPSLRWFLRTREKQQ